MSLYQGCIVCVRVERKVGKYFEVRGILSHGFMISTWMRNRFVDKVVKEVNEDPRWNGTSLRKKEEM